MRWVDAESDFRQHFSRRIDSLKVVGTSNTTGLLSVVVFLTTTHHAFADILSAKVCLGVFAVGICFYIASLLVYYFSEAGMAWALLHLRSHNKVDNVELEKLLVYVRDRSKFAGLCLIASFLFFSIGALTAPASILIILQLVLSEYSINDLRCAKIILFVIYNSFQEVFR